MFFYSKQKNEQILLFYQLGGKTLKDIIVVGGGIGGLCTAILLKNKGFTVRIYEAASSIKSTGAGIGIGSNALKALETSGIHDQLVEQGNPLEKQVFIDEQDQKLMELNFSLIKKQFGTNNISIHRGDLLSVLCKSISPQMINYNKRCMNFTQTNEKIEIIFEDGSKDTADLVIAADGIHSVFRQNLVPGSFPRYAGYTCWRGVVDNKGRIDTRTSFEIMGNTGRFGVVPLKNDQVYWFACINAQRKDPAYQNLKSTDVANMFREFPRHAAGFISETPTDQILHHDILDIKPLKSFTFGRVVLLGDAAHATTPNMGQGAGQAIEDAIILTNALTQSPTPKEAFHTYNKSRIERTTKIINMSRQIGTVAQIENPILAKIRNTVFKYTPPTLLHKGLQFLYNVDF